MFANPDWFNDVSLSALPAPKTSKGRAFYAICLTGILAPAILLAVRGQVFPEAAIWLGISVMAFLLEIRGLRRDLKQRSALRNMYYIDDATAPQVETDQYELQLKKPV